MAIPEFAYTQTVAKQLMANATGVSAWVMFINVKSDITVYKQIASNQQVELIPEADYTVTITPASPWEFTWTYSGATPPLNADHIIIFRRVGAIFNDFQPGAFLNADSLNQAFNIETLANNDVGYYQQFSRPGYDDKTLVEKGVFDPPVSVGESDHNPKIAESNYELPYLASSPGVAAGDVYVWGYVVDPGPVASPRTGKFVDTLLHQSGGGTVGQLTQELAAECLVPGSNIIGVCNTTIAAAGWTPGPGMTLSAYLGNLYHRSNTNAENGANLIGYNRDTAPHTGQYSVQTFLNNLADKGTPGNYASDSGASYIGYEGWSVSNNTVAGCLSRLNEPATSAADSGATHVKFWDISPTVPVSKSVQEGLNELWQAIHNSEQPINVVVTIPNYTAGLSPTVIPIPPGPATLFANLNRLHIRTQYSNFIIHNEIALAGTTVLDWHYGQWQTATDFLQMQLDRTAAATPVWTTKIQSASGMVTPTFPAQITFSFFLKGAVPP